MFARRTSRQSLPSPTNNYRYHPLLRSSGAFDSEQNLMLALLRDAIESAFSPNSSEQLRRQAWDWIEGNGIALVSFESACEAVGFDCGSIRGHLKTLQTHVANGRTGRALRRGRSPRVQ